jgi:ADP-ribosylglycohydrolase
MTRIVGCLKALASGDAIGKQTEMLSREGVQRWYPNGVRGFEGPPGSVIPRYAHNVRYQWRFGETTDDTERTIAVARAILEDHDVRHVSVGRQMLACTKCVHPGVKSLWEFHQSGDAARVTENHNGCGAAIRVAPVGILYRSRRLEEIVEGTRQASISTPGGALALAAAAAVAAAVSAAIDDAAPSDIVEIAQEAAARAEQKRTGSTKAALAKAIRTIYSDLRQPLELKASDVAAKYFPDNPLTIVPLAIVLAAVVPSAESVILLATNIGGDSDSVASIAGAIVGARNPASVNENWNAAVESMNAHGLTGLGESLARLRH